MNPTNASKRILGDDEFSIIEQDNREKSASPSNDATPFKMLSLSFVVSLLLPLIQIILFTRGIYETNMFEDIQVMFLTPIVIFLLSDIIGITLAARAIAKKKNNYAILSIILNAYLLLNKLPAFIPIVLSMFISALLKKF